MPLADSRSMIYVCDECHKPAQFIHCKANPQAEEWYCEKCHKSYLVKDVLNDEAMPVQSQD